MFSLPLYIIMAAIGFMMAFLYKRANTFAKVFSPDPRTALRLFIGVFVVSIITTYLLSFFAIRSLSHATIPEDGDMRYSNLWQTMFFVINLSFLLLTIIANAYSQALKKITIPPYVFAICFYALFVLKDAYYMTPYYLWWRDTVPQVGTVFPDGNSVNTAWLKCFFGADVVAFNAIIIAWGLRKKI